MSVTPEILERLQGVQRTGEGWLAFCPAHEDREQRSLSISQTPERTLLHCFVGCPPEQIVRAAGTTLASLFTTNTSSSPARGSAGNGARPVLTLEAFAAANMDLLSSRPSILDRYYRAGTLASERARRSFVLPDRLVP